MVNHAGHMELIQIGSSSSEGPIKAFKYSQPKHDRSLTCRAENSGIVAD